MILIYSEEIGPRLSYIAYELLERRCGIEFKLSDKLDYYLNFSGPRINYSLNQSLPGFQIGPVGLLSSKTKPNQKLDILQNIHENPPVLFPSKGPLAVDILSEAFYHLSRWEEYEAVDLDKYGRFQAEYSTLHKFELLDYPVIELELEHLKEALRKLYPDISFGTRNYRYIPSVDIDNAYAYLHKSQQRGIASTAKDLLKLNFANLKRRVRVLRGKQNDPYDTYKLLDEAHASCRERPYYFFLLADEGKYDRNLSFDQPAMQSLLNDVASKAYIGLHPGMGSNKDYSKLISEKERLEKLSGQECLRSRQHYLYLRFPETYRALIKAGIKEDYSMGYASQTGFRAGTCLPFYFYDILEERQTELLVYPFAFMDTTLHLYLGLEKDEALIKVKELVGRIKSVNGICISLWHNETLGGIWHWEAWESAYSDIVQICNE